MAKRPVFVHLPKAPFCETVEVEFTFHPGLSTAQHQRNICEIHTEFAKINPEIRVLEISRKSMQDEGKELSAFHLCMHVPTAADTWIPVECVYHAAKVFEQGGPYMDLLEVTPKQAKRDPRLKESGRLMGFRWEGNFCAAEHFYNYIYIKALMDPQNAQKAKTVLAYDAYTDVVYSPARSKGCQARAAAIFKGLWQAGLLDHVRDHASFEALMAGRIAENDGSVRQGLRI